MISAHQGSRTQLHRQTRLRISLWESVQIEDQFLQVSFEVVRGAGGDPFRESIDR